MSGTELQLYRPDGERFATYIELAALREQERQDKEQAQQQLGQAQQQLEQEKARTQQLATKLRELGINPDKL
jgi:protein-disulfide isomerase